MNSLIHRIPFPNVFIFLCLFVCSGVYAQDRLNIADLTKHDYANPSKGREGHDYTDVEVNSLRVYDFYSRQADYYMDMDPSEWPERFPAFMGLDGGTHGHWGKYNQNSHKDSRWNDMDIGSVVEGIYHHEKLTVIKGVNIRLGNEGQLATVFDPHTLGYRNVWHGGFVEVDPQRWGVMRGSIQVGETLYYSSGLMAAGRDSWIENVQKGDAQYHGFYRHDDRVILSYSVGDVQILDHPWALDDSQVMTRTIQSDRELPVLRLRLAVVNNEWKIPPNEGAVLSLKDGDGFFFARVSHAGSSSFHLEKGELWLELKDVSPERAATIYTWGGESRSDLKVVENVVMADTPLNDLRSMTKGGAPQWPDVLSGSVELSNVKDRAYLIDTFSVPFDNPYHSMMFFTGIGFLSNGDVILSTLMGDLWKVKGLAGKGAVTWKRFAVGLNLPIGVKVIDDKVYAIGREQLSRITDLDGDDEADFYENIANDFFGMPKAAPHTYGLDVDPEGNFYYIAGTSVYKTPHDGSPTQLVATGLRNCMAYGIDNVGTLLVGPQEGIRTPASMVVQVHDGEFYGHSNQGKEDGSDISPPLCYIPRGVDNSSGGFVFNDSDKFGPLKERFFGLSYGLGSWYTILRDTSTARPQGAVVPMQGEFLAGLIRGAFHPIDGQLYVVGLDGWGDYSQQDGCLQRLRYSGKPVYKPQGFAVHQNGIRIDFTTELDQESATRLKNYFVQEWEYEYTLGYGSPEYSVRQPGKMGHDPVQVSRAMFLKGGKSVFLEISGIKPVMQMHIRMHLRTATGDDFKTDLFPSIINLGQPYRFKGAAAVVKNKPSTLKLRTNLKNNYRPSRDGLAGEVTREITLDAVGGLKFAQETLTAKAGDVVALTLVNQDVMPHNFALVVPGAYEKIGLASFNMVNDPKGLGKSYVPNDPDVVTHTPMVFPGEQVTIYFRVPDTLGEYPYLCTFPGHWQIMKGIMTVEQ